MLAKPLVSIIMGSANDWEVMQQSARALQDFGASFLVCHSMRG